MLPHRVDRIGREHADAALPVRDWRELADHHHGRPVCHRGQSRPALVCTEFNEKIPPPIKFAVRFDPAHRYGVDHFFGYSLAMLAGLAERVRALVRGRVT